MGSSSSEHQGLLLSTAALDPLVRELDHLQNLLKEKDGELGESHAEIKTLRLAQRVKDKAVEELSRQVGTLDEKLRINQNLVEKKNLEMRRLRDDKKEALTAKYAAEAALRKGHAANQKDQHSVIPPLEAVIAPLEAEIKLQNKEIAALREDNKALERLNKSKELALVEAQKILESALERTLIVEDVQNHNMELKRQIELCQQENRILDKNYRQKVCEVEKLAQSIRHLEECILAGGEAANELRDYHRQILQINDEKKALEREIARAKVWANSASDKGVIPIKQWIEERRSLQAEMQRLKNKLDVSERSAKAQSHLKEKFRMRLRSLEQGILKHMSLSEQSDGMIKENINNAAAAEEEEDQVSGFLYDRLQRMVSSLEKQCKEKHTTLQAKEEEIKMLQSKVDAQSRHMKPKRGASKEREAAAVFTNNSKDNKRRLSINKQNKITTTSTFNK
ncbi:hypothetical protein ACHQM5_002604 [Ranunculus cassubicifolius]